MEVGKINKIQVRVGPKTYVVEGGDGSTPGENTVGSQQIIDDSVKMEDLDPELRRQIEESDEILEDGSLDGIDDEIEGIFFPDGMPADSDGTTEAAAGGGTDDSGD